MDVADLLSEPTNYAVVQIPGRAFPGVVFQGDSLAILISDIETASMESDAQERQASLAEVLERLRNVQTHYETVLRGRGIQLPYCKA